MKPSANIQPNARKFPLVDYCYHAPMLNPASAPRVKRSNSLRDISRDYFDAEKRTASLRPKLLRSARLSSWQ